MVKTSLQMLMANHGISRNQLKVNPWVQAASPRHAATSCDEEMTSSPPSIPCHHYRYPLPSTSPWADSDQNKLANYRGRHMPLLLWLSEQQRDSRGTIDNSRLGGLQGTASFSRHRGGGCTLPACTALICLDVEQF